MGKAQAFSTWAHTKFVSPKWRENKHEKLVACPITILPQIKSHLHSSSTWNTSDISLPIASLLFLLHNHNHVKLDMAKWVRIFWPDLKNTWPEPVIFLTWSKNRLTHDLWPNSCFLQVNPTQPKPEPEPEPFF